MGWTPRNFLDMIVQFPYRYNMKNPATGAVIDTVDLEPAFGAVTESGTDLNRAYFQPMEDFLANIEAIKLVTPRTINGIEFDGSGNISHYGISYTAAATADKTVNVTGTFIRAAGAIVTVTFTAGNTAANPTLSVNNTAAAPIRYKNGSVTAGASGHIQANGTYNFVFDGSNYQIIEDDTRATYTAVNSLINVSFTNRLAVGSYVGNATSAATVSQAINVGFMPTAVILSMQRLQSSGAWPGASNETIAFGTGGFSSGGVQYLQMTGSGFQTSGTSTNGWNISGHNYWYVAIRL